MAGIYLHIPFCKRKCHYCNFFSLATTKYRLEFVAALLKEIHERKDYLQAEIIDSIYFGGGTPSLLSMEQLTTILDALFNSFTIKNNAEITLEANPDDLNKSYLQQLKNTPVNRLSIGIQSFNNDELKYINRVHNGQEAINAVKDAQNTGFHNLSIDLIYGIPNSSLQSWEKNLEIASSLQAPHLSAYSLTQEPNTAYDILVKKGKLKAPEDEKAIHQYEILQSRLPELQMEQYEISNYATKEKYARHNTSYWQGVSYLGLGPSAHSFNGKTRRWNISNLSKYIQSSEEGEVLAEQESLSMVDKWNEWVMTGLRTKWGLVPEEKEQLFPKEWILLLEQKSQAFIQQGLLIKDKQSYVLSNRGKLFADGISAEFFIET